MSKVVCLIYECDKEGVYAMYCEKHIHYDRCETPKIFMKNRKIKVWSIIKGGDISQDVDGKIFFITDRGVILYTLMLGYRLIYKINEQISSKYVLCIGDCNVLCNRQKYRCSDIDNVIEKYKFNVHYINIYKSVIENNNLIDIFRDTLESNMAESNDRVINKIRSDLSKFKPTPINISKFIQDYNINSVGYYNLM